MTDCLPKITIMKRLLTAGSLFIMALFFSAAGHAQNNPASRQAEMKQ